MISGQVLSSVIITIQYDIVHVVICFPSINLFFYYYIYCVIACVDNAPLG
jgi:hypothetical protein